MIMQKFVVNGSWLEIGQSLGKKQKSEARKIILGRVMPHELLKLADREMGLIKRADWRAFEFIQGLSQGTGIDLKKLVVFHAWQDWLMKIEHCSTFLGQESGRWFMVHNEDYDQSCRRALLLVEVHPKNGLGFSVLQYAGLLPGDTIGVNQAGFGICMNNIWRKHMPVTTGLTMAVVGFQLLQCRNWSEVLKTYAAAKVNTGMHFLVVEKNNKALSMESFPDAKARAWVSPGFVHTNHALLPKTRLGSSASDSSKMRLQALAGLSSSARLLDALRILQTSIIDGGAKVRPTAKSQDATLATVIIKPAARRMIVKQ